MAWTIPDKGEGDNDLQSVMFQEMLDVLVAGIAGTDCVLSGCAITGGADMTPAVAKGAVLSNGTLFAVAAADVTITTADGTNPRLDLIVVTSAGALAVRAGTAAASPKPPARTANDVVLGMVYVPASDTAIATTQITDMRVFRTQGPIVVGKTSTAVTFANSTSAQTYFTLTIPNGLLSTGRVLRFRAGGSFLYNSGATGTRTFSFLYGGTTLWSDASPAFAATDADSSGWSLQVDLFAVSSSSQNLIGMIHLQDVTAARTAPTSGTAGDLATTNNSTSLVGSASVDSDSANRDFVFQITMSTTGTNNSSTMTAATLELL